MIPLEGPFVLLDDARTNGASPARLYTNPVEVLTAYDGDALSALLVSLRQARQDGLHAAGFFGYEAGAHLLPGLTPTPSGLLAWFGLFKDFSAISAGAVASVLPDPAGAWLSEPVPYTHLTLPTNRAVYVFGVCFSCRQQFTFTTRNRTVLNRY